MTTQWIPSNGTEGNQFINDWCSRCARDSVCNGQKTFDDCDDSELCPILAAAGVQVEHGQPVTSPPARPAGTSRQPGLR